MRSGLVSLLVGFLLVFLFGAFFCLFCPLLVALVAFVFFVFFGFPFLCLAVFWALCFMGFETRLDL